MKSSQVVATLMALSIAAACPTAASQTCPSGNPRIAPDSRYLDHGNGTVTDLHAGLMWTRCSEGQSGAACSGTRSLQTWEQALTSAANSGYAGYSDWRLPSVKELQTLVETGCHSPSINSNSFPNTGNDWYWTSTTVASYPSLAWSVYFGYGYVNYGNIKSNSFGVRLVRAGQ